MAASLPNPDRFADECEGCDAPATRQDCDGVPLCGDCYDGLDDEPEEAHTPGPWRAEIWSRHAATTVLVDDGASFVRVIAQCETETDARLIAAAPDLLKALTDALACMQWADLPAKDARAAEVHAAARAALAKAGVVS